MEASATILTYIVMTLSNVE